MAFVREVAQRVFAQEFNAGRIEIKGEGEKDPSFVITPAGAKINRLHVVGVCTECEPVGEAGETWRARISDPTGIFTVYAGQYQPEAAQVLSELEPPCFLAVTGKARTYEPEPGSIFTSIRPETISVVDEASRDLWVLQAAERTKERLETVDQLRAEPQTDKEGLIAKGARPAVAEAAVLAQEHYGMLDVTGHWETIRVALGGLLPGGVFETHTIQRNEDEAPSAPAVPAYQAPSKPEENPADDAFDDAVLAVVSKLEGDNGANWDDILGEVQTANQGSTDEAIEESLNRLMDKGLVYEPTLGVLKTT